MVVGGMWYLLMIDRIERLLILVLSFLALNVFDVLS